MSARGIFYFHRGAFHRGAASALLLALLGAGGAAADERALRLDSPLECVVGKDCFVQNYVDRDPGPGARDHTCGPLTYDGHKGTDIRLPHLAAMRAGVGVVAAATGRVRAVRDGMDDINIREGGRERVKGRECGNGVVLVHGGGWETQYCHMLKGSIAVKRGERVAAGQRLGLVGLSGMTEFPHVMLVVRHHGTVVDPYVGEGKREGCGVMAAPLWTAEAAKALAYRPSGLLSAGFTDSVPKLAEIDQGRHRNARLPAHGRFLVFWTHIFGLRQGDVEELRVRGPDGRVVVETKGDPAAKNKARWFRYAGKRQRGRGWPPGVYRGEYRLERDGETVLQASREVELH